MSGHCFNDWYAGGWKLRELDGRWLYELVDGFEFPFPRDEGKVDRVGPADDFAGLVFWLTDLLMAGSGFRGSGVVVFGGEGFEYRSGIASSPRCLKSSPSS